MAVTWQCAAGYDPSAEAGTQFAFAAVLPEGYALLEGVSLPEILVTLTPPLANAMLMAEGIVDSGEGWTLSDDGTLTVTGYVMSSTIESFESAVKNIEVTETGMLSLETAPFLDGTSGSITIAAGGYLTNYATISGGTIIVNGIMENTSVGSISGGTFTVDGEMYNNGSISNGKFTVNATMANYGTISKGTFIVNATMDNYDSISGGTFTVNDKMNNLEGATITGGTITIPSGGRLQNKGSISGDKSGGTFIVDGRMNNQGTITEGTFTVNVGGTMENDGSITRGTFTVKGTMSNLRYGTITGGAFTILADGFLRNSKTISGGTFTGKVDNLNGGTITGGAFGKLHLYSNSCVQGEGDSVPTVNGHIENVDGQILQPCNFGAGASVEKNTGTIEVSATVNGASKSLFYGEKTLEQLKEINANDVCLSRRRTGRRRAWPKAPPSILSAEPM